jgi:hypothetical protein
MDGVLYWTWCALRELWFSVVWLLTCRKFGAEIDILRFNPAGMLPSLGLPDGTSKDERRFFSFTTDDTERRSSEAIRAKYIPNSVRKLSPQRPTKTRLKPR